MADREHEYEIVRHDKDQVVGRVWWNGKKIEADDPTIIHSLRGQVTGGKSLEDGVEFLKRLPSLFKSGYVSARKVK